MTCWGPSQGKRNECTPAGDHQPKSDSVATLRLGEGEELGVPSLPRWAESELASHLSPDPPPYPPYTQACTPSLQQRLRPRVKRELQRQGLEPGWLAVGRFQAGLQEVVVRASSGVPMHPLCIPGPQPWLPPTGFEACHCPAGPWPPTPLIAILTGPFYLPSPLPISPHPQPYSKEPDILSWPVIT